MTTPTWLIVGLGNPGAQYEQTRHNIGQRAVESYAERLGLRFSSHKAQARLASGRMPAVPGTPEGPRLLFALPNGYMNTSGGPVNALVRYFGLSADRVIVLHDELDLPFDSVKLKQGGGHGGHNGLRNIAQALGTPDFYRVRIGVGRPPGRQDPADFVLSPFASSERKALPLLLADAVDATETLITEGLLAAQQQFHGKESR